MPPDRRITIWHWSILSIIFLAAIALRVYRLDATSMWFDEAWHLELSTGRGTAHEAVPFNTILRQPKVTMLAGALPAWTVWTSLDRVTHPPLYMLLLRCWREMAGEGQLAGRLLAVIQSSLAVLVLFDVVRVLHGTRAALWAAAIAAAASAQIILAQEVRGYAQLVLASLLAGDAAARIVALGPTRRRFFGLAAGLLAMMLTHYFAIGIAAAIAAYVLVSLRGRDRRNAIKTIAAAAVVYAVIWGPFLYRQASSFADAGETWLRDDAPGATLRTLDQFAVTPARLLFEPMLRSYPMVYGGALIFLVLPLMATLGRRRDLLLWALWLCCGVGFLLILDLARNTIHLSFLRYVVACGPAVYAFLAAATAHRPGWIRDAVPAAALLATLGGLPTAYEVARPDWPSAARTFDERAKPGELVVFIRAGNDLSDRVPSYFWAIHYLCISHYANTFPREFLVIDAAPPPEILAELRRRESFWVISNLIDSSSTLPGARQTETHFFPFAANIVKVEWEE